MAASAANAGQAALEIYTPDGKTQLVSLKGDRCRVGRASTNDLSYPGVTGLSREHCAFEREGAKWFVRDVGSTYGTVLNGTAVKERQALQTGDRVALGPLILVFKDATAPAPQTVLFFEDSAVPAASTTMAESLDDLVRHNDLHGGTHMKALIRAGRELGGHMPLEKLFELILNLSVEAVGASRGVLMTLEKAEL